MPFDSHVTSDGSDAGRQMTLGGGAPPETSSHAVESVAQQAAPPTVDAVEGTAAPVWLQRISLFVLVLFCVYLGVMVMILPWWRRVWDQNLFIQSRPALAAVLYNGAVRGLISGLGLLDIWIGVSEVIHYRDHKR